MVSGLQFVGDDPRYVSPSRHLSHDIRVRVHEDMVVLLNSCSLS